MNKTTIALIVAIVAIVGALVYMSSSTIVSVIESKVVATPAEVVAPVVPLAPVAPAQTAQVETPVPVAVAPRVEAPKATPVHSKLVFKKHGHRVKVNKEANAYLQAYLNEFIHDCLRDVVDYKIDGDVKLGTYRDFGNVLDFYHREPKNFLQTAVFTDLCHLPETDTSLAKGADQNSAHF